MTIEDEKMEGYITLKEASERFGYAPDYIGQLIRKGKIEGKQVYANVAWMTTITAMEAYVAGTKGTPRDEPGPGILMSRFLASRWVTVGLWTVIIALIFLVFIVVFVLSSISTDHARMDAEMRQDASLEQLSRVIVPVKEQAVPL